MMSLEKVTYCYCFKIDHNFFKTQRHRQEVIANTKMMLFYLFNVRLIKRLPGNTDMFLITYVLTMTPAPGTITCAEYKISSTYKKEMKSFTD